jgi:SAM-dependent methyltransferase
MGWGLKGILGVLPSPTLVPHQHIPDTLSMLRPGARVCDVGAGGRRVVPNVVAIDAVPVPGVDTIGEIHNLPVSSESFDCVICTGTLEHVLDPRQAVRELYRILTPGGIVHIDVPFIQGYHPDPTDYWRFTLDGLKALCSDFEELASGVQIGPTCGLVWITREWVNSWTSNRILSNVFLSIAALLLAPLKYLDYILIRGQRSHHVASAVYFRGRKPSAESKPAPREGRSFGATR